MFFLISHKNDSWIIGALILLLNLKFRHIGAEVVDAKKIAAAPMAQPLFFHSFLK